MKENFDYPNEQIEIITDRINEIEDNIINMNNSQDDYINSLFDNDENYNDNENNDNENNDDENNNDKNTEEI